MIKFNKLIIKTLKKFRYYNIKLSNYKMIFIQNRIK